MDMANSAQQLQASYIREILQAANGPNVISLAGGLPSENTFPLKLIENFFKNITEQKALFQYAPTQGYPPLVNYLTGEYQLSNEQELLICNGAQQGIDLVARCLLNSSDCVALEAPSYLGALQVFQLAQANIQSVPQTKHGPDLNQLEALFRQGKTKLFYAVPDFHNPTGVRWTLTTRQAVANLCRKYQVILLEDTPYRALSFDGSQLPLVSSLCPELAITLYSFSKITTPGMRLGAVVGPSTWMQTITKIKQATDLHTNQPLQAALLSLLSHPEFPLHLQQVRNAYQAQYQVLTQALDKTMANDCDYSSVQGGMFIWLQLKSKNADTVAELALTHGVAVVPSSVFYSKADSTQQALRLNFTHASPQQITQAISGLAKIIIA